MTDTENRLQAVQKALDSVSSEFDADVIDDFEIGLEALASTLLDLASIDDEASMSLSDVVDLLAARDRFSSLAGVYDIVVQLEEYSSAVEYGICTLDDEELNHAENCRADVVDAIEALIEDFT